MAKKEQKEK